MNVTDIDNFDVSSLIIEDSFTEKDGKRIVRLYTSDENGKHQKMLFKLGPVKCKTSSNHVHLFVPEDTFMHAKLCNLDEHITINACKHNEKWFGADMNETDIQSLYKETIGTISKTHKACRFTTLNKATLFDHTNKELTKSDITDADVFYALIQIEHIQIDKSGFKLACSTLQLKMKEPEPEPEPESKPEPEPEKEFELIEYNSEMGILL